jgi:hypothetical protein
VIPVASEQGLRARAGWSATAHRGLALEGEARLRARAQHRAAGYTSFNRYYFAQQDKQGAIIDERYNGGGSAADYIIEVLQRDFDGYFNNAVGDRRPFTSPSAGIWGPKVMIINEMAGSGGDLMPYMFKRRKIGPLVGKRTWGGLVHTADTPALVDGGTMIAPRGGFFTRDGKWAVENEGIAPDIDVENTPKEVIAGHDPQLERAVAEALRMLAERPVDRRTTEPPPPTWGPARAPLTDPGGGRALRRPSATARPPVSGGRMSAVTRPIAAPLPPASAPPRRARTRGAPRLAAGRALSALLWAGCLAVAAGVIATAPDAGAAATAATPSSRGSCARWR